MMRLCLAGSWVLVLAGATWVSAQQPMLPDAPPTARAKPDATIGAAPSTPAALTAAPLLPRGAFSAPADNFAGSRLWFGTEALLWWSKSSPAPPLAVTANAPPPAGPVVGTAPVPGIGFIGLTNFSGVPNPITPAATPFGGNLRGGPQVGFRATLGGWLDSSQVLGLEGGYLLLLANPAHYDPAAGSSPTIAIPLVNPLTGAPSSYAITQPPTTQTSQQFVNTTPGVFVHLFTRTTTDQAAGALSEHNGSTLQGGDLNAIWNPIRATNWRLQGLAGVRFLQFNETLHIDSNVNLREDNTTVFEPALGLGVGPLTQNLNAITQRSDVFVTRNGFYGGQLGARGEYRLGRWSLFGGAKVALGDMHQIVQIDGSTSYTATTTATPAHDIKLAGIPLTVPVAGAANVTSTTSGTSAGGLFAQPGNIGHYSRDILAVVPEANFRVAYRLTSRLTASVGYTFLYMSNVARPAELVDRNVNPAALTTPPGIATTHPSFSFHGSDYWAQGIDFGLQYRY